MKEGTLSLCSLLSPFWLALSIVGAKNGGGEAAEGSVLRDKI